MQKTILLVEDEEIISVLQRNFLVDCGYIVLRASDIASTFNIIRAENKIDLILMDIELREYKDGIDLAQEILNDRDIPIIFLSNQSDQDTLTKAKNISSYGFVYKNTPIPFLITSIEMALKLFESKQSAKSIEETVRKSESHYRLLFEEAIDAIFLIDTNGYYIDANPSACLLTGYSIDEIKKMSIRDILPPEDTDIHPPRLAELLSKKQLITQRRIIRKDGTIRLVELRSNIRHDNSIQTIALDITERSELEQELKNSQIELIQRQFAIDQHAIVAITNVAGTIKYVNDHFCEISGYPREELVGENHRLINSGHHSKQFWENMYSTVKKGHVWNGKIKNRAKNGDFYWVDTTIAPIKDANGKIFQYLAIRTVITEEIKAKEILLEQHTALEIQNEQLQKTNLELEISQAKYFDLYDLAPVGYLTINEIGIIEEANLTLDLLLGLNRNDVINKPFLNFIDSHYSKIYSQKINYLLETGIPQIFELEIQSSKNKFWARLNAVLRHDIENKPKLRITLIDISATKLLEVENAKYLEYLKELNNTKDKFFNIIAHDLRNPFGGILGISELLDKKLKEINQENLSPLLDYTRMIQSASKSAFSLLENLLLWARSQTGDITARPILLDMNHLIDFIIPIVSGNAFNKKIDIETNLFGDVKIYADESFTSTILLNLLTNAIKFTKQNGKILISTEIKEEFLVTSITDSGTGIEKEHQNNLFKIHSKVSKLGTQNEKGSGLGLILCKDFVEKQNGKIWVKSELGIGSTFSFSLPLNKIQQNKNYSTYAI